MPLSEAGKKIRNAMREEYGKEKGDRIFYSKENKDPDFAQRVRKGDAKSKAEWWAARLLRLPASVKSKIVEKLKNNSNLYWWVERVIARAKVTENPAEKIKLKSDKKSVSGAPHKLEEPTYTDL